jgi:hypothetical protein
MSLFICDGCGFVDNTALCQYHNRVAKKLPRLCSECDPEIGKWHGRFTKRRPEDFLTDDRGRLLALKPSAR